MKNASLSVDGRYRFDLYRRWAPVDRRMATWVMLNPSTADASQDDQTIRRCIAFSQVAEMDALTVVNLYALRATNPAELASADDPIGPGNGDVVRRAVMDAELVIAAWGGHPMARRSAAWSVVINLALAGHIELWCLGTTAAGEPHHPARLAASTPLVPYMR